MRAIAIAFALAACGAPPRARSPIANASGTIALPIGPFATRAPAGPYRSMADWCADLARRDHAAERAEYVREVDTDEGYEPDPTLGCRAAYTPFVTHGASAIDGDGAIARAALVPTSSLAMPAGCALVLHAGDRIYAIEDVTECMPPPGEDTITHTVEVELAWRDLIDEGVGPELVLTIATTRESMAAIGAERLVRSMFVCGAGKSRQPRCTPELPIASHDPEFLLDYHPGITRDGTLRFAVEDHGGGGLDPEDDRYDRPHLLRFP